MVCSMPWPNPKPEFWNQDKPRNQDAVQFVMFVWFYDEKLRAICDLRARRNLEAEACIEHRFLLPWLLVAWTLSLVSDIAVQSLQSARATDKPER